ncbi:major facilitator superfamily domain-containing protein [Gongronella butleri]|nr:major facilitator superfamily domain-containing protein [Gongronella butleri]
MSIKEEEGVSSRAASIVDSEPLASRDASEKPAPLADDEPYTILKRWQIIGMLTITATAGMLSPLSASIYFPALNEIQADFGITAEQVNLTVTTYLIFQAISPTFWGSISDTWGRRPVFMGTTLVYIAASVGMATTRSYGAMLFLRMLQSFGSSSLIAVGAGVIGDIAVPSQRGSMYGYYNMAQLLGKRVGSVAELRPVIGGVIAGTIGWRWMFWILAVMAIVCFVLLTLFVPETLRSLVGNGSIYANPTIWQWWKRRAAIKKNQPVAPCASSFLSRLRNVPNFLRPFLFVLQLDVFLVLLYNGVHFMALYYYLVSSPSQFAERYGLSTVQVGLCFLGQGAGSMLGSLTSGRALDYIYRRTLEKYKQEHQGVVVERGKIPIDFPIYRARTLLMVPAGLCVQLLTIIYGWMLQINASLGGLIVIQFLVSLFTIPIISIAQTLTVDLYPAHGASVTASNNLVRCILAAIASVSTEPGIASVGPGWFFTIIGLVCFAFNGIYFLLLAVGPKMRRQRMEKEKTDAT